MASVDEDEIHLNSFNSNWKHFGKRNTDLKTYNQQKLVINYRSQTDSFFQSPGDEFNDFFNEYHGLEPDFKYYDNHKFHSMSEKLTNPFSIIHTNICSLQQNGENLEDLIIDLKFKFDIIAVTESWNPEDKKYKFSPPIFEGYSPYTGTTGSSLKGGCGFYINSDLKFQPRKDLNTKIKDLTCEVESCWIEIIIDKQPNILICVLYRHPRKNDVGCLQGAQLRLPNDSERVKELKGRKSLLMDLIDEEQKMKQFTRVNKIISDVEEAGGSTAQHFGK